MDNSTGFTQIFVFGAPRSGTTFLSSLLDESRFGAPFETHFIPKYFLKLSRYGDLSNKTNFMKLMNDIMGERPVQQWKLNIDLNDFFDKVSPNYSYSNIVNCLIREKRQGLNAWGDKTPSYLRNPEIILELFPEAKFIFIVRDGRDVALSLLKKPWGPNNILACAQYWASLNRNFPVILNHVDKENLLILKYEELLDDTGTHINRIYSFIGESIPPEEVNRLAESVKGGNYEKWRSQLSPRELRMFEAEAQDQLEYFDYPLTSNSPKISKAERISAVVHNRIKHAIFLFNTNVIDGFRIRFLGKEPFDE